MTKLPIASASLRNSAAILGVLRYELADRTSLLEIGSGTGQHAVAFAAEMPALAWQTSDLIANHSDIQAHIDARNPGNVKPPLDLDVRDANIALSTYDAVYTCNTLHIMSFAAVESLMTLVSSTLPSGGVFCVYGPFRVKGAFNSESNATFDASLRASDSDQGIRDLEAIDKFAAHGELRRVRSYAMPANNLLMVWIKSVENNQ